MDLSYNRSCYCIFPPMASFRSLSVLSAPRTRHHALIYGHIDSVDKILARFADAGEFDELETVYDNVSKSAKDHIHSEYASRP